jgi:hypothetical protein
MSRSMSRSAAVAAIYLPPAASGCEDWEQPQDWGQCVSFE